MTPVKKRSGSKRRLDQLLVERALAASRSEALALLMAGRVVVDNQRVEKGGTLFPADVTITVKASKTPYVSRAGEKLVSALIDLDLTGRISGAVVLDIGASTGGFTHACLELGARHVIALDVGTAQLAHKLRQDPRVTTLEATDIRAFDPRACPAVDFVVADISFNSLARLASAIAQAATAVGTGFLLLVKPQFELPRDAVPAGGVVKDPGLRAEAVDKVRTAVRTAGLTPVAAIDSKLPGRSGNVEVFLFCERRASTGESQS